MSDAHAEALKTRITAYTLVPTYDLDEAKAVATLPATYSLIFLSYRATDNPRRADGTFEPTGRRLSTRVVSKSITNARLAEQRIWSALHLNPVTLGGAAVDVHYESGGGDFEQDEGFFTALTDWTFVL